MTSQRIYTLPVAQTGWAVNGSFETIFNWEYDDMRDRLITLYSKGKQKQWDAEVRIDWEQDLDPENPMELADEYLGIYGTDLWNKMTQKERAELRLHGQAWQISQFLHGEQGALICAAKIVETVPDIDSKFYAATQVIDEARHVEVYSRFLHEKFELAYPITQPLKEMLEQVIRDSRWDFTYLGMQILIEGLALAAFGLIRDFSQNPLASAINAYVM
ncbi:MAG: diiron oxygenase, partial [Actinomycetota bacterium]